MKATNRKTQPSTAPAPNSESPEYARFRDLTKRLVSVPKKEINGQPERKRAKKSR
jgi:hypothetical protein